MSPAATLARNVAAIAAVQGHTPAVDVAAAADVRVERGAGGPVLRWHRGGRWLALNSARDPLAEAHRWLDDAGIDGGTSSIVVVGAGLGYVLDALEERSPSCRVALVEPLTGAARALLERRDWTPWIESARLRLLVGPDYAGSAGSWRVDDGGGDPPLLVHPVLAREAAGDVTAATHAVQRLLFNARANAAARRQNAARYLLNTLRNIPIIARSADAAALFGLFEGRPAIVASAGPSLDRNIRDLARLEPRAILIAVDTAARPLLAGGVTPHLIVAVDPTRANGEHLRGLPNAASTALVAEGSLDPEALSLFADRAFVFNVADHHPWPWLREHGCRPTTLKVHGSVATAAVDLAGRLGCDPIVFCGQDLAFTASRAYCSGTTRDLWPAAGGGWPGVQALDVHGRATATAAHLVAFRDWIVERSIEDTPRRYINASGDGILHGGRIEVLALERALQPFAALDDDAVRAAIRQVHTVAPSAGIVREAAALASRLERDPTEQAAPIDAWQAFAGQSAGVREIRAALATPAAPPPDDPLRDGLLADVAGAAAREMAIAAAEPVAGPAGDDPLARCERLSTVARYLGHARGWRNGSVLPRRDVHQLVRLCAETDAGQVLVLGGANSLTALIARACVASASQIHAVADPETQTLVREVSALARCSAEITWHATATEPSLEAAAAGGFALVLADLDDSPADAAAIEYAARWLAARGTLVLIDRRDRTTGAALRRDLVDVLAQLPALAMAPLRTTGRFSRLAVLRLEERCDASATPSPMATPFEAAAVADMVVQRFTPSSIVVFGRAAATWAEPFAGWPAISTRVADMNSLTAEVEATGDRADVAICIDTMEFVPPDDEARALQRVTAASDTMVFAVPTPGLFGAGYPNARPMAYWAGRLLDFGFVLEDALRPQHEDRADFCLRQTDLTLYLARRMPEPARTALAASPELKAIMTRQTARVEDLFVQAATLRLAVREAGAAEVDDLRLLPAQTDTVAIATFEIEHVDGHRYIARPGDTRARLCQHLGLMRQGTIEEDGRPLLVQGSLIDDIGRLGRGRYYLSPDAIHFSTSDNSDPRTNGRLYAVRLPVTVARLARCPVARPLP